LDGREIAGLGVGGSTMLDVPVGPRKITVDAQGHPNEYTITLQAKPGMLYTLEVSPRGEAVAAGMFGLVGMLAEASSTRTAAPSRSASSRPNRPSNRSTTHQASATSRLAPAIGRTAMAEPAQHQRG